MYDQGYDFDTYNKSYELVLETDVIADKYAVESAREKLDVEFGHMIPMFGCVVHDVEGMVSAIETVILMKTRDKAEFVKKLAEACDGQLDMFRRSEEFRDAVSRCNGLAEHLLWQQCEVDFGKIEW